MVQGPCSGAVQGAALAGILDAAARLHPVPLSATGRGVPHQGIQELLIGLRIIYVTYGTMVKTVLSHCCCDPYSGSSLQYVCTS